MLINNKMKQSTGILFAADIVEKERLLSVIEDVSPHVDGVKLGNLVLLEHGLSILRSVKEFTDKPVIADIKLLDVPYIAGGITEKILKYGGDGIMVSGAAGGDVLTTCKSILGEKMLFVFTQFTHMSGLITDKMADEYIELALATKSDGVQVPATVPGRVSRVRKDLGKSLSIISCGIGAQGAEIGSAIRDGADFEIIGRAIYKPSDHIRTPGEAAEIAKLKIQEVLKNESRSGNGALLKRSLSLLDSITTAPLARNNGTISS